jgi:hypothetical protein
MEVDPPAIVAEAAAADAMDAEDDCVVTKALGVVWRRRQHGKPAGAARMEVRRSAPTANCRCKFPKI